MYNHNIVILALNSYYIFPISSVVFFSIFVKVVVVRVMVVVVVVRVAAFEICAKIRLHSGRIRNIFG